ncbi:DnaJ-domain-containing protein [Saitoella complicata NRRL Y-17804]|nr:DnaJ-domain-containing protein [Saitoella complicata NRRL Y-17804]ODQ53889.1 DnaJ-domain-containing protein [Saitoella complicata NRRL Y-17804]
MVDLNEPVPPQRENGARSGQGDVHGGAKMSPKATRIVEEILQLDDLYQILGASRTSKPEELRRAYLDRCRICHPDKLPNVPAATAAFQKVSFAYDILSSSSNRRIYDHAGTPPSSISSATTTAPFLGEYTFRSAVAAVLREFMEGDFTLLRKAFQVLNRQYPSLGLGEEVLEAVERSFSRLREVVLATQTYALLLSIELHRVNRVRQHMSTLSYFDLVNRFHVSVQLARVTLAIPMRIDYATRMRAEERERARGEVEGERERGRRGLLNERVMKLLGGVVDVLEMMENHRGVDLDDEEDDAGSSSSASSEGERNDWIRDPGERRSRSRRSSSTGYDFNRTRANGWFWSERPTPNPNETRAGG